MIEDSFKKLSCCLVINKLIRFAMKFQINRLEALLLNYLTTSFFTNENVLGLLLDSVRGKKTCLSNLDESLDNIRLESVEVL